MQIKFTFTTKVVHLASFWKWRFLELGSGLFKISLTLLKEGWMKHSKQRYIFLIFRCWINGSVWIFKGPILAILVVRCYYHHMYLIFNLPIIVRVWDIYAEFWRVRRTNESTKDQWKNLTTRKVSVTSSSPQMSTRSHLQRHSVSLAWRLDREMRRRLILHETKQIYSLNVFYFLLYRRRYLATSGNTSAVAGYTRV